MRIFKKNQQMTYGISCTYFVFSACGTHFNVEGLLLKSREWSVFLCLFLPVTKAVSIPFYTTLYLQLSFYRPLCYNSSAHCPLLLCIRTTSAILAGAHSYFVVSSFRGIISYHSYHQPTNVTDETLGVSSIQLGTRTGAGGTATQKESFFWLQPMAPWKLVPITVVTKRSKEIF